MLTSPPSPEIVTPIVSHLLRRRDNNQGLTKLEVLPSKLEMCDAKLSIKKYYDFYMFLDRLKKYMYIKELVDNLIVQNK